MTIGHYTYAAITTNSPFSPWQWNGKDRNLQALSNASFICWYPAYLMVKVIIGIEGFIANNHASCLRDLTFAMVVH